MMDGNIDSTRLFVALAEYFKQLSRLVLSENQPCINGGKITELQLGELAALNDQMNHKHLIFLTLCLSPITINFCLLRDEHTLVSFLRKNIPCNCLDEKYNEVKDTVKKMGLCQNRHCKIPGCQVERSKMLKCARCLSVSYCSSECQAAHWCEHKKRCKMLSKSKEH